MAVTVSLTSRRSHWLARLSRRVRAVVGGILLTGAAAASMVIAIVPALLVVGAGGGGGGEGGLSDDDRRVLGLLGRAWLIALVVTVTGWAAGGALLRGRRGMVLWLRRFRYGDATRVVSGALDYIGRSWRVVTLDDAATEPVGVAAGLRLSTGVLSGARRVAPRVVRAAVVVGKVLALVSVAGIVAVVAWSQYHGELDELFDALSSGRDGPSESRAALLLWIFGAVLLGELAVMVGYVVLLVAVIPLIGLTVLVGRVTSDVRAAELAKARSVRTLADVDAAAGSLAASSRGLFAPRLSVLTVDGAVWRPTVTGLAQRSDAVLVDVSEVTDNVLWEVEAMAGLPGTATVFVGRHDRAVALAGAAPPGGQPATWAWPRLAQLLDGREILAYTTGLVGRWRFQRALFGVLEDAAPRRPARRADVIRFVLVLAGMVGFALAVRAAVTLVAGER
jgi:hypothetical protein